MILCVGVTNEKKLVLTLFGQKMCKTRGTIASIPALIRPAQPGSEKIYCLIVVCQIKSIVTFSALQS